MLISVPIQVVLIAQHCQEQPGFHNGGGGGPSLQRNAMERKNIAYLDIHSSFKPSRCLDFHASYIRNNTTHPLLLQNLMAAVFSPPPPPPPMKILDETLMTAIEYQLNFDAVSVD